MVIAAIGTVLAAGYLLWMYQRVAFGEPKPEFADAHIHDVNIVEWIAWTPMLIFIVVLGVYPDIIFSVTDPTVTHLTRLIGRRADANPGWDFHAIAPRSSSRRRSSSC